MYQVAVVVGEPIHWDDESVFLQFQTGEVNRILKATMTTFVLNDLFSEVDESGQLGRCEFWFKVHVCASLCSRLAPGADDPQWNTPARAW